MGGGCQYVVGVLVCVCRICECEQVVFVCACTYLAVACSPYTYTLPLTSTLMNVSTHTPPHSVSHLVL